MEKRIADMISQLTLEEKISLCSGSDFWHTKAVEKLGLPRVMMCDGPHGLRKQEGDGDHLGINKSIETVCYPTASALASSFDREVLMKLGEVLGEECQAEDVGMLLGPGLNLKRSPLCGRNFEYLSEDPYLAGELGAAYINGLQSKGVAACVKHFAANNQETHRMSGSSNLDERTLHEIYLQAFESSIKKGKARSVMCAYNAVNGTFCAENKELLTDILREKWGFNGFVVTDWGAAKDPVKGIDAGLDLVMPGGYDTMTVPVTAAIQNGEIAESDLDAAAANILQFVCDYMDNRKEGTVIDREKCEAFSSDLATQCAVLMKNDGILPLDRSSKAAFIGAFAKTPRYQGSGSSYINTAHVISAAEAAESLNVVYAEGYLLGSDEISKELVKEAVDTAKQAEAAVIFAGLPDAFESEGIDRTTLDMPANQRTLIEAVAEVQENTIVVLHGGAPMRMPWLDKVKAVLCMYLGGQGVGRATVQILYGDVNPSGKLAETWPLKLSDNPSYLNFPGADGIVDYREGIYIGYRYYDKKEMEVLFPFGHGLSYTEFEYAELKLDKNSMADTETLTVSCKVRNNGSRRGKEVIQLYIADKESSVGRPIRELKGFEKVELEPGQETEVFFTLDKRSFAYYEPQIHDWFVESGVFVVEIGASSRDIRLAAEMKVQGTVELPFHYTPLSPMGSLLKTAKGRAFLEQIMQTMGRESQQSDDLGEASGKMMEAMLMEMPLSAMTNFGGMSMEQLLETVELLNN